MVRLDLEQYRRMGHDLQVVAARYVPLTIEQFPSAWVESSDDAPIINTTVQLTAQTDGNLDHTDR